MRRILSGITVIVLVACVSIGTLGQAAAQAPPTSTDATSAAPDAQAETVARAGSAMQALQGALLGRLREEMTRGGPPAAITVCRDEAQAITARIAREQGIAI